MIHNPVNKETHSFALEEARKFEKEGKMSDPFEGIRLKSEEPLKLVFPDSFQAKCKLLAVKVIVNKSSQSNESVLVMENGFIVFDAENKAKFVLNGFRNRACRFT
jgi:hypothetical protein